jgi:hypothetical protein
MKTSKFIKTNRGVIHKELEFPKNVALYQNKNILVTDLHVSLISLHLDNAKES